MTAVGKRQPSASQRPVSTQEIVGLLSEPASYPEVPSCVQVVETHISWVFLTDRFVYKLKKPVRFDFLDFRTAEKRQAACQAEIHLNRRLAPHVYLGVLPITIDRRGRPTLDGHGPPVDWVVKMRRLASERCLETILRAGALSEIELNQLASTLAAFYQALPPLTIQVEHYVGRLESWIRLNRDELLAPCHQLPHLLVQRVHQAQLRIPLLAPQLLRHRVLDGRVVEGHGDLRPEHIYFTPQPTIIDGVEFNRTLRQLDVLDELGFLAMECDSLQAHHVGQRILECYQRVSGDRPGPELQAFYQCYRAGVRAKIAALQAAQQFPGPHAGKSAEACHYLQLAGSYARQLGPPLVLIFRGLTGTGKTTLATVVEAALTVPVLQAETPRPNSVQHRPSSAPPAPGNHDDMTDAVCQDLLQRAGTLVDYECSVILDGDFFKASSLQQAYQWSQRRQALAAVIVCECPRAVALERLVTRSSGPGVHPPDAIRRYARQYRQQEPIPSQLPICHVDTTQSPPEMLQTVFRFLGGLLWPNWDPS